MYFRMTGLRGIIPAAFLLACFLLGCAGRGPGVWPPAAAYAPRAERIPAAEDWWQRAAGSLLQSPRALKDLHRDARLAPLARELAEIRLTRRLPGESPERFLDSLCARTGVAARPVSADWRLFDGPLEPRRDRATVWLAETLHRFQSQGYSHAAVAQAIDGKGNLALAVTAVWRSVTLTRPLPRRVERGGRLVFESVIGDEAGLAYLMAQAPNGRMVELAFPYWAGDLHFALTLAFRGDYRFELLVPELDGGRRTVLRFDVAVGQSARQNPVVALAEVSPRDFVRTMENAIAVQRRRMGKAVLPRLVKSIDALGVWVGREAEGLSPTMTAFQRTVTLSDYPGWECRYFSTYTDDLNALAAANLLRPAYRSLAVARRAKGYAAHVSPVGSGYRVGELICASPAAPARPLLDLSRYSERYRLIDHQREVLARTLGLEVEEDAATALARLEWSAALETMDRHGGLPGILLQSLRVGQQEDPNYTEFKRVELDEAFATLWHAAAVMESRLPVGDARRGASRLPVLEALLHQGRPEAYRHELERVSTTGPRSGWAVTRVALGQAWLAAYLGDPKRALEHLLVAIKGYEMLHYDHLLKKLALQMVLLAKLAQAKEGSDLLPEGLR